MASFDIIVRTRGSLHPDGEPTRFVSEYDGVVTCTDDATGNTTNVGRVHALRVHAALAESAGEPLFDVCDAHSGELHHLHALLYEPDGYSFREGIAQRFDAVETDLLVLDFVVLSPRWRRLKLGLLAVRRLVDLVGGGCGLAVSFIAPLRRDAAKLLRVRPSWLPRQTSKEARRQSTIKLRRYFRRMGFRRLGRSPYYALSMSQVTPSAAELLGGEPDGG
jgi:hypothetical protein